MFPTKAQFCRGKDTYNALHTSHSRVPLKLQDLRAHPWYLDNSILAGRKRYVIFIRPDPDGHILSRIMTNIAYDARVILAFVTLRLYSLWDHRRIVNLSLGVALVTTYIPVFVLGGMSLSEYYRNYRPMWCQNIRIN